MFKWACLLVAVCFLSALTWMVNDLRLEVQRSIRVFQASGQTINEELPPLVDKVGNSADMVARELPVVVEKLRKSAETLADLAEDIRQLKEFSKIRATP